MAVGGDRLIIEGGNPLKGEVAISGAKNAALPLLAATLLTPEECLIENVPDIDDIHTMVALLASLGAQVEYSPREHRVQICAKGIDNLSPPYELIQKMRASFLVVGPLLARFGEFRSSPPGGCSIGLRPVNFDIQGFRRMGAEISLEDGAYVARARALKGERIFMDYPSHTGTENLMMAACLSQGTTVIRNASAEPEAVELGRCLQAMGGRIHGLGSSTLRIEGVEGLHGGHFRAIPDRMEAGTFVIATVATGGQVLLRGVDCNHMDALIYKLREMGARLEEGEGCLLVRGGEGLSAVEIQTFPYPGFPTDLQPVICALLCRAKGSSPVYERVHRERFHHVAALCAMGAHIEVQGVSACIHGPTVLHGERVEARDLRSGGALVVAGLMAQGVTELANVFHVDRGHENIVGKLSALGARLERVVAVSKLEAPLKV